MQFTKSIIVETLSPYRGKNYLSESEDIKFRWATMLPANTDDMDKDFLYVCYLSEALKRRSEAEGYYYLCIQDRFIDESDEGIGQTLSGMIILHENKEIAWLLNLVQSRLLTISEWIQNMQNALISKCDYQKLIDLCEPILNNFVAVLDSSYKLLAYTRNIECDDPINISLIEKGYHTEETIKLLREKRRFKFYDENENLYTTSAGYISRYDTCGKWCRRGGVPLIQVIMACGHTPLNSAMLDLFEMLVNAVDVCCQREHDNPSPNSAQLYYSLFTDILYNDLQNNLIITERAKSANVPLSGIFNVYRIVFEDNVIVFVNRLVQDLLTAIPNSRVIAHHYEIVVHNSYKEEHVQELSALNIAQIRPLLEKYNAKCGVSSEFYRFGDFRNAYVQSSRAQFIGNQLHGAFTDFDGDTMPQFDKRAFLYDDLYVYYMLYAAKTDVYNVFTNNYYDKVLKKLISYDKEHGTSLTQVLYLFLLHERHATRVGKLLHMHRNNVLYHISRIEEIMRINLDDPQTRLKLLLTYQLYDITDFS